MSDPAATIDGMPAFAVVGPYVAILLASCLPTQIWRWLGVLLAGRVDESSEIFVWVKSVATALVAGVIAKLILTPGGALAETPVLLRIGAIAVGFAAYLACGKRLAFGILATEVVLVGGWLTLR